MVWTSLEDARGLRYCNSLAARAFSSRDFRGDAMAVAARSRISLRLSGFRLNFDLLNLAFP